MTNRTYLPFQSAREYEDRGMVKWSGFFLSEHTTALAKGDESIDFSRQMEWEEILFLLGQLYTNGQRISLYTKREQRPYRGKITEIFGETLYFRKEEGEVICLSPEEILSIRPLEDIL